MFTVGCHLDFFVCVFKDRNPIVNQVQPYSKRTGLQGGLQILLTLPSPYGIPRAIGTECLPRKQIIWITWSHITM